eukprot:TRINITY_DN55770_c0_g1_i1.p1 TRINITY_DN55770_c0_g1~~TRINITY_DN55770_c0_g1_i1.p1  ORF type:complete len:755 (+),score=161.49 TRINITY_DN55770_c0_g1_i1:80-2344(+)
MHDDDDHPLHRPTNLAYLRHQKSSTFPPPLPSPSSLRRRRSASCSLLLMKSAPSHSVHLGKPHPLGATATDRGTNFAIYAREPVKATLLLRAPSSSDSSQKSTLEFKLGTQHRTGHVWHVEIRPAVTHFSYLWQIGDHDGSWITNACLDPYATLLDTPVGVDRFNERKVEYEPWGIVEDRTSSFDWMDVPKPKIPFKDLIIYEMHVRGFSRLQYDGDGDSAHKAGSFLAVIDRIPYLKMLGVNAVELLPVMEFNESEWSKTSPDSGKPLCQYWGYSTVSFFCAMNRYGTNNSSAADVKAQFQTMVRELHREGIEVILDVVYNHTAEMGHDYVGRGFYGMKQLAPTTYYIMKEHGTKFVNHSGCGNTLNCNNAIVQNLICDSLLYWAHEMGVDGFRFDLASVLCRDTNGELMDKPPVIERMTKHPSMRDVKLIAEPWDCGGAYQVGSFPHHGVWGEWNGKFRDCIRRFFRGDAHSVGEFASRLCGSQDLYGARAPFHSINFVCAHDGFPLRDVVSYAHKHNDANGEHNRDGEEHNLSWNCGVEGDDGASDGVRALRERHMANMMTALLVSAGTPMVRMGDEVAHTQLGNNNAWCQDSALSYLAARSDECGWHMLQRTAVLTALRAELPQLRRERFLRDDDVSWFGERGAAPQWHDAHNVLALLLRGERDGAPSLFAAFNGSASARTVRTPHERMTRVLDTQRERAQHVCLRRELPAASDYVLAAHSCVLLLSCDGEGARVLRSLTRAAEKARAQR